VTFAEVIDNAKLLLGRSTQGLLGAFVVIQVASMLLQAPNWVVGYLQGAAAMEGRLGEMGTLGIASCCVLSVMLPLSFLLGALTLGLYRVARSLLLEPSAAPHSFVPALKMASGRFIHLVAVMVVYMLLIVVGTLLCIIPGLVAAVACLGAPYLVATQGTDLMDAFKQSVEMVKANLGAILGLFGVAIVITVVVVGGISVGSILLQSTAGPWLQLVTQPIVALISAALGYAFFIVGAALLVTIETRSSGIPIAR
jgi:hypothetical protein